MEAVARGENVVVAAPTGSGKTLIAEYAIEQAVERGERVIYTAPIKALSNQKYRDLSELYPGKVGISTGDVSIESNAPIVVMTTEIFRNTIFDNPERAEQIGWVIFDEVHYLDDPERGTVWEESLIFAPKNVRILALSATVSNLDEFVDWLREVRDHPARVVLETRRSVPLEVHAWSTEGDVAPIHELDRLQIGRRGYRSRYKKRQEDVRGYYERSQEGLVELVKDREELPLLFFLFSRAACERLALGVALHHDLARDEAAGREARDEFLRLAAAFELDPADPEVGQLAGMVQRGVAYHHAGILPALKEVIERLFAGNHIRLLCATETFALGVNMPARAVAFEGVMRWNGSARVPLKTREYQQMAGRAGRRGIDDQGSVYVTYDPFRDDTRTVMGIVEGTVEPVRSQFNLSYGTLLNLYERLGDELLTACERSFANYRVKHGKGGGKGGRRGEKREGSRGGAVRGRARRGRDKRGRGSGESGRHNQGGKRGSRRNRPGRRERQGEEPRPRRNNYEGIVEQVEVKMHLLEELGYLDSQGRITERGRFCMQVFGHEIELTELVFSRALEGLSPEQVAVVAAAIVFESRNVYYGGKDPKRLVGKQAHRLAEKAVGGLVRLEEARGVRYPSKLLDWNLSGTVWQWVNGAEFSQLRELSDSSDGDIVRALRQTIQLLRLAHDPLVDRGQRDLAAKVRKAQGLLKRDLVDAEWQLRRAAELERLEAEGAGGGQAPAEVGSDSVGFAEGLLDESGEDLDGPQAESPAAEAGEREGGADESEASAPARRGPSFDPDEFSKGLL